MSGKEKTRFVYPPSAKPGFTNHIPSVILKEGESVSWTWASMNGVSNAFVVGCVIISKPMKINKIVVEGRLF